MARAKKIINNEKVMIDGKVLSFEETVGLLLETKTDLKNANACLSQYAKEKHEMECVINEQKHQISELESELRVKEDLFTIKGAISGGRPSTEWYEQRYQSDCITINQLHTTIDVLTDKLARLREVKGL